MSSTEQKEGIKISIKDFIFRYKRYIPLFLLSIIITVTAAYIYLRYATPYYNARATILIKSDKSPAGGGDQEFERIFLNKGGSKVDDEIEILKSQNLAKRVVKALNLQTKYYAVGNIRTSLIFGTQPFNLEVVKLEDSSQYHSFKVKMIDGDHFLLDQATNSISFNQTFKTGAGIFRLMKKDTLFQTLQYKDYLVTISPLSDAVNELLGSLTVNQIEDRSNVLLLSYKTLHAEMGAAILNQLMMEYQNMSVEDKNQISARTISFITDRLKIITNELGEVEHNLQNYKQQNKIFNIGTQSELYLQNQSDVEKQLSENEVKLKVISYLKEYLDQKENAYSIVPSSLGIDEPTHIQLVTKFNELQQRRDAELKTTTADNPTIIVINSQLNKLRNDIITNLNNIYESAKMLNQSLRSKSEGFKSNISTIPLKEKELLEITRQQGIKQSLYLYLLQKREETAISLASTISNSQVIDSGTSSNIPVQPNPKNVKIFAVFLGLLIPAAFLYLKELFNDKVDSLNDIKRITQTPVIGEIGHSNENKALVVQENTRNIISEQFRMIRTNLQYLTGNKKTSVILVTSTFSSEGKSFVSTNLAAVLALAGKKTVILEFDIRKPKIASGLNMPKSQGITNYLVGNTPLSQLPVKVPNVEGLYVISSGAIPPNPAEMLLHEKLEDLFAYVRDQFEIVIVDSAPVGLVSDAQVLSRYADTTLYLVRLNYTLKKQIHFIDDLYVNNKLPKLALLVNDIKESSHYYSYGNYSGYGYGLSYQGLENGHPKSQFARSFKKLGTFFKASK